jgi:hypothetical protein
MCRIIAACLVIAGPALLVGAGADAQTTTTGSVGCAAIT